MIYSIQKLIFTLSRSRVFLAIASLVVSLSIGILINSPTAKAENKPWQIEIQIPLISQELDPGAEAYIVEYIDGIYRFVVMALGAFGVVMFMIGGFQYLTSAGNQAAAGEAKKTMISALAGTIIVVSAYLLLKLINKEFVELENPDLSQ